MFERYNERARRVVTCAQDEARELKHNYIGTEHLLLGLLHDPLPAEILGGLGIGLDDARAYVGRVVGSGDVASTGQIPFTPRSKKVLEFSLREALSLGHNYIGPDHVLLGLVREADGVAWRFLSDEKGVSADDVRNAVIDKLTNRPRAIPPSLTELAGNVERARARFAQAEADLDTAVDALRAAIEQDAA